MSGSDGDRVERVEEHLYLEIARRILALCKGRGAGRTLCPSEIARSFSDEEATWRALMPDVRRVAADLADDGRLVVTQKGRVVDARSARGPIRLAIRTG